METDYCLVIMTKERSIFDKLWFETFEEAEEELKFCQQYYKEEGYKYKIIKEKTNES